MPQNDKQVKFYFGTQQEYNNLSLKDTCAIYLITDTRKIYVGNTEYTEDTQMNDNTKQYIDSNIDNVGARIDNIIAHNNDTEGNSELIDIRTGADGTTYSTAGKAVRSQISDIKNTAVICANHRVTDSADEYYDANNVPPGKIIAYGNSGTNIPDLLGLCSALRELPPTDVPKYI